MLSIIFLHWIRDENGPLAVTLKSIESVLKNTYGEYELIIVSNGTFDKANEEIKRRVEETMAGYCPKRIKYIYLSENMGVSKGFNAGLKEINSDTKYISIFANDWFVAPNWNKYMQDALDNDPYMGFATATTNHGTGSMCDDRQNPVCFNKPIIEINDKDFYNKLKIVGEHCLKTNKHTTINSFPCVGFMLKKEVFDKIGLFDERIFCANDVAWGKLAALHGYYSKTVWASYIHHVWHSSFSQINDPKTYSYLRPKDEADWNLILTDPKYQVK